MSVLPETGKAAVETIMEPGIGRRTDHVLPTPQTESRRLIRLWLRTRPVIGKRTAPAKVRKRIKGNVQKGNPHDGGFPFYSGSIWIREGKGGLLQESTHLKQGLEFRNVDRFRYRTRYFTDSGIIGTKEFVSRVYQDFKGYFASTHEKRPKPVKGLESVYSLKRLSESIA